MSDEQPWLKDPAVPAAAGLDEPWNKDPVLVRPVHVNPEAPWESDPQPATWWKTIKSIPGTAQGQFKKSLGGMMQNIAETDYESSLAAERGGVQATSQKPEFKPNTGMQEAGETMADIGSEQIKEEHPGQMTFWQKAVQGGVSSTISQTPALVASLLARNPSPALASAAALTFGSTYAENREKGIEPGRASLHAGVDATAEAALELLPTKFLIDNAAKPIASLMFGTLLREIPTEVLTTAIQSANAKISTRPEMTWEEYGQDILDTIGATMVSAPLTGGTAKIAQMGVEAADDKRPLNLPKIDALDLRKEGEVNPELTTPTTPSAPPPPPAQPTTLPDSNQKAQIEALVASIDAELLDDQVVAEAQARVKKHEEARKANPQAEAAWFGFATAPTLQEDAAEIGASAKQAANAKNYINPNTGDRMDRQFLFGPEGSVGLTMRAAEMKPATYTLGQPTDDRPLDYLEAVHNSIEQWRQKFLPNATIVVSNEQLFNDTALGSHYLVMPGQHLIVPAVLRSPTKGLGAFNLNTQASAFYNLTHEFGHAIVKDKFLEGIDPALAVEVVGQSERGLVSEEIIAKLPEAQQAVVREFNTIKEAIANNRLSAQQFVETWMSPAKGQGRNILGDLGVLPTDNAMDVVDAIINRAAKKKNITDGSKVKDLRERMRRDYLSLDEYLAEQTTRHAYEAKWDQTSALGKFFKGALESLRNFFASLKKDGSVAPGTAFKEWIEGLSKGDRPLTVGQRVAEGKKKGAAPAKVQGEGKTPPRTKQASPTKKVQKVEHNEVTDTTQDKAAKGRQLVAELVRTGVVEANDSNFKELLGYLKTQDWAEFVDVYQRLAGKNVKLQTDPTAAQSGHVGIKTDIKALVELFGLNMYNGKVDDVLVKELVQNSFDAVKAQLYNKRASVGNIMVTIDPQAKTISVQDDGVGMDKATLLTAFLTYPGTSKPDLPMEHRSGGLGQAKQLLLFTPQKILVRTVKDGQLTILRATPQQLLDGTAEISTEPTDEPSGTRVDVALPKTVIRDGKEVEVEVSNATFKYNILENPPLYPGVKLKVTFVGGIFGTTTEEIQDLLKTHQLFKRAQGDWGYVDIYQGKVHTGDWAEYTAKHRVMSAGAWQFNTQIIGFDKKKLPMDLVFDFHPSVAGQHSAYPFTANRQGLKENAMKLMEDALDAIREEYYKQMLRAHVEAYSKVEVVAPWSEGNPNVRAMAQGVGTDMALFTDPEFTVTEDENKVPIINFTRGIAPPAFYYNSTNKDYLKVPGARIMISKLVAAQQEFMKFYTERHDSKGALYSVGVGFDKSNSGENGWTGLHFRRPYHAVWVNPVSNPSITNPAQAAASTLHTMMHEAMHINASFHDAAAFWELAVMYTKMDAAGRLTQIKHAFEEVYLEHWDTFQAIKELYSATDTVSTGEVIKGDSSQRLRDIESAERSLEAIRAGGKPASSFADEGGPWRNTSFELDVSEHPGARRILGGVKNFLSDFPRLRRALRSVGNAVYHTLELQQLAHLNPDVSELAFMNEKNGEYNRYKSRLQAQADAVLNDWNSLGKENFAKLNKFMLAEAESGQLWYDLIKTEVVRDGRPAVWYEYMPNAITALKAQEFGIDERLATIALKAKNVLLSQLNEAEFALLSLLGKRYANAGQDVLTAAFIPVKRHIHELRKVPFFPQGRFGNRMLIIEKKKTSGPGYDIVWREHFEDPVQWEEAWKKAVAKAGPDERVRKEQLSDQHYVLMALPTDFIDMAASELGLSDEQLEILMNILQPVKRDKVLGVYDQQRLGIKGYTTDAMRSFANFTWHNSNLLAKLIYRADFNWAIRGVGVKLRDAKYATDPDSLAQVERLDHIKSYMERVRDYVMAPPNEAQQLRAFVSILYLGLNIKTALLNTYGLITTWSDLTSRLGQVEGNKLALRAATQTFRSIKLTSLNERRPGQYLPPEAQAALDKAIEEGVLSQSYAYHLAGMANAGNLYRLPARQIVGRIGQHGIDAAMYVFRLTELSTRRASFLAEFEAARKQPNTSAEEAYQIAVDRTNKLQNDYSLGNRVPFMRGFKLDKGNPLGKWVEPVVPLATVFMSFAQHMAFHAYGGYELGERRMAKELGETPRTIWGGYTMKIWIITLLLAGYEGLPGAENLIDLLETLWRKLGRDKTIRQELREFVQALEVDPQLVARGLGHNVAGFDISRSVGFGRIVPGTDVLAHPRDSMAENLGLLTLDLAGPTGGFIKFGLDAVGSNKSKAEAFERLPGGLGNIYTAYRWSQHGVRAPSGARITHDLQSGELRDLTATEILGKGLGFNPTVVSQNREVRFDQYDRKVYWQTRRELMMRDLFKARLEKDREAEADAKKAIVEYNAGVPAEYRQLRVTGADIAKSMQARQRILRADEKQTTTQRRYKPLYEDVKSSYE